MIYFLRADLKTAKVVCNQINSCLNVNTDSKFHVIFVPKMLAVIELLFEEEGLIGKVNFHTYTWELIQLDSKILSFETPKIFRQLFVENDQSLLTSVAKSLWSVQHIFGRPTACLFHGKNSKTVANLLECWMEEAGEPDRPDSDVGFMLVLDRDVDYASVLLMPGTYTCLISEVMNLASGTVELKQQNKEKKELAVSMLLTSEDELYNKIKNRHFSDVNIYLKQKANELICEKNKGANMSIKEMKQFVESHLEKLRNDSMTLGNHFNICERICQEMGKVFEGVHTCQTNILFGDARKEVLTEIEDMIAAQVDMYIPLRLISLFSVALNGFTLDESYNLKRQFLHSYGYEHLSLFYNLEKNNLFFVEPNPGEISAKIASKVAQIVPFPKRNTFQTIAQKFKLFPDTSKNYCLKNPQDAGYVFGGAYIPLVAQIVMYIIKKEINMSELIKYLSVNVNGKAETKLIGNIGDGLFDISPRTIFVYIVGGITYAEIAALQFIEAKTGCRILCCGSNIINAKTLLQSAC